MTSLLSSRRYLLKDAISALFDLYVSISVISLLDDVIISGPWNLVGLYTSIVIADLDTESNLLYSLHVSASDVTPMSSICAVPIYAICGNIKLAFMMTSVVNVVPTPVYTLLAIVPLFVVVPDISSNIFTFDDNVPFIFRLLSIVTVLE